MKRLFIISLVAAMVLCGCQKKAVEPVSSASIYETATTVMGRVSYVSGNDFTLAVGEYSGATSQGTAQGGGTAPTDDGATASQGGGTAPTDDGATASRGAGNAPTDDGATASQGAGESPTGDGAIAPQGGGEAPPTDGTAPQGESQTDATAKGDRATGGGGVASTQKFVESGEELSLRIPVGTPILYGSLNVDFSQIQTDYIVSVVYNLNDSGSGTLVLSAEILST